MKFSSKIEKCGLSPIRKFGPAAAAAEERGTKIYHLNIGQPDIATPAAYFDALKRFDKPVVEYAPSAGINELIDAVRGYYAKIGVELDRGDVLVTTGGSVKEVMEVVKEHGGELVGVGLLVDRSGGKVDFGVRTEALLHLNVETFDPATCPLCAKGVPFTKRGRTGK